MLRGSWVMLQLALIAYHAHRPELCLKCNGSGQSEIVSFQTDFYLNQKTNTGCGLLCFLVFDFLLYYNQLFVFAFTGVAHMDQLKEHSCQQGQLCNPDLF